jgi:hypothetical protein
MSTRTIVTSQPDVACELCARRLLRGETHEVFIADGRARNVCELCAPRAADAGWIRERDGESALMTSAPPRRGPRFFERLPVLGRGRPGSRAAERSRGARERGGDPLEDGEVEVPDYADGGDVLDGAPPVWVERTPAPSELQPDTRAPVGSAALLDGYGVVEALDDRLLAAAEVFNESEFPRRVAALARSLGEPEVSMLAAEHLDSAIRITVAWELCWYRYEVDLSEQPPEVRALAQGTELSELPREERHGNARATPAGTLALA